MVAPQQNGTQLPNIPIRFSVPEQFQEVSLEEMPEQRAQRQYDALVRTFSDLGSTQCIRLVLAQEMGLSYLIESGAIYAATCLARSEAEPSMGVTAFFTVIVKEAELHGDRPLVDIAKGLRTPGEPREIIFNHFPAGEALVVGEEVVVTQPVSVLGESRQERHRLRQAQVIFALPGNEAVAILTMASPGLYDWTHFVATLNGISHSISFGNSRESAVTLRLDGKL